MTTYSTVLKLELPGDGQQVGTWGQTTNKNFGQLVEQAITGVQTITMVDADYTLTNLNGTVDEARNAALVAVGTNNAVRKIVIPLNTKLYTVSNQTTGGYAITVGASTGNYVTIPNGTTTLVYCDGTNTVVGINGIAGAFSVSGAATVTGNLTVGGNTSLTGTLGVAGAASFTNTVGFSVTPTAPTQAVGTSNTTLATTAFVQAAIPSGIILMWSGSIASIPSGWYLCNGSNGTPDLRDRFVVGAGGSYAVAATGGATAVSLGTTNLPSHTHSVSITTSTADLSHTHSVSATATTGVQSVGHTHTYSGTSSGQSQTHTHTVSDPGHSHYLPGNNWVYNVAGAGQALNIRGDYGATTAALINNPNTSTATTGITNGNASVDHTHTYSGTTSGVSADHTHDVTITATSGAMSANSTHSHTVSGNTGATGSGTAFSILPPYYALAYIMRA